MKTDFLNIGGASLKRRLFGRGTRSITRASNLTPILHNSLSGITMGKMPTTESDLDQNLFFGATGTTAAAAGNKDSWKKNQSSSIPLYHVCIAPRTRTVAPGLTPCRGAIREIVSIYCPERQNCLLSSFPGRHVDISPIILQSGSRRNKYSEVFFRHESCSRQGHLIYITADFFVSCIHP